MPPYTPLALHSLGFLVACRQEVFAGAEQSHASEESAEKHLQSHSQQGPFWFFVGLSGRTTAANATVLCLHFVWVQFSGGVPCSNADGQLCCASWRRQTLIFCRTNNQVLCMIFCHSKCWILDGCGLKAEAAVRCLRLILALRPDLDIPSSCIDATVPSYWRGCFK